MLPDLARFGGQFPRSGSFSRCGDLVSRSGNLGNFFFQKKKKTPQTWPDLEIWPVFFFSSDFWLLSPRERDSRIFFFAPKKANFDDLRPLKAKFDTFEHLWGSKTWFRAPEISWFLPKTSRFLKNLEKITIYSPPFSGVLFCDNFTHFFPRRGLLNLPSEARQIECTSLGKK